MNGPRNIAAWKPRLIILALQCLLGGCATISLSEAIEPDQTYKRHSLASVEKVEWASTLPGGGMVICVTGPTIGKYDNTDKPARFTLRVNDQAFSIPGEDGPDTSLPQRLDVSPDRITKGCGSGSAGARLAIDTITISDVMVGEEERWQGWDKAILNRRAAGDESEVLYDVRTVSAGGLIYYDPGKEAHSPDRFYRITPDRTKTQNKPALKVLYPITVLIDIVTSPVQYLALVFLVTIGELPPD